MLAVMSQARWADWDEETRQLNERYHEHVRGTLEILDRMKARTQRIQDIGHSLQTILADFLAATTLMQMLQDSRSRESNSREESQNDPRYVSAIF